MLLANSAVSALLNVLLLAGLPFLFYYVYHKRRKEVGFKEITQRAGLQLGEHRYLGYSLLFAFVAVVALIVWPPPLEASIREGSAFQVFDGLDLGTPAIMMALFYGVVKTGFAEEFLFRGLIAGSLSRRLPILWANLVQALIFLLPHVLVVLIMPEMWILLPLIFIGSLFVGWVRIRSGSMVGPWLIHASVNVATALSVVIRSGV